MAAPVDIMKRIAPFEILNSIVGLIAINVVDLVHALRRIAQKGKGDETVNANVQMNLVTDKVRSLISVIVKKQFVEFSRTGARYGQSSLYSSKIRDRIVRITRARHPYLVRQVRFVLDRVFVQVIATSHATFAAFTCYTEFLRTIFIEFLKRKALFAQRTNLFGYNAVRHIGLLFSSICLGLPLVTLSPRRPVSIIASTA